MLESLVLSSSPVRVVRESAVVAAPPFTGFTTEVSAGGTTALTAGYDGSLVFWRVAPNGAVAFLDALRVERGTTPSTAGTAYALSPDGRRFAISTGGGRLEVWDRATLKPTFACETGAPAYDKVAFHPRRPWLFFQAEGKDGRVDLDTGKTIALVGGWPLLAVPNSDLLASPAGLTDGITGRLVRPWRSRTPNDLPMRVSPDGKLLVMAGEDPGWSPPQEAATEAAYARSQTLRTWRIADGRLLQTMPGFWTMNSAPRDLVWLDSRRVEVPGLGLVRDALTGRTVRKGTESKPTIDRGLGDVSVVVSGARADRLLRLRFPDAGARTAFVGFGSGTMAAVHEVRTGFRNPGTSVGGAQAVTLVTSRGDRTVPDGGMSGGVVAFDERGAYGLERWGDQGTAGSIVLELIRRPFDKNTLELRRTLIPNGGGIKVDTYRLVDRSEVGAHIPEGYRSFQGAAAAEMDAERLLLVPLFNSQEGVTAYSRRDGRRLWHVAEGKLHVATTSLAVDRDWAAFAWQDYATQRTELVLARTATGEIVHRIPVSSVVTAAFSPDGKTLAAVLDDGIALLDPNASSPTFRRMGELTLDGNLFDPRLYWTASGRLVATAALAPIGVFDPVSGRLIATARFYGDGRWSALRADGAVDGSARTDVRVWQNGRWTAPPRRDAFFLDLLR